MIGHEPEHDERGELWGAIPERAFADDLGSTDFKALGMIAKYDRLSLERGEGAGCYRSINRLAAEIRMDPRQFRRSVDKLVARGYILKTPRGEVWEGYVLRIIYRGEDPTVPNPLDSTVTPPPVSEVTIPRTGESSGCGLHGHHIKKKGKDTSTKPLKKDSSLQDKERQSGQDEVVRKIVAYWSAVATPAGAVAVRKVDDKRRRRILRCVASDGLEDILAAIDRIARTNWATGKGKKDYRVDLEWLLRPGNVNSVLEGKYDDRLEGDAFTRLLHRAVWGGFAATVADADWSEDAGCPESEYMSDLEMIEAVYSEIPEGETP